MPYKTNHKSGNALGLRPASAKADCENFTSQDPFRYRKMDK